MGLSYLLQPAGTDTASQIGYMLRVTARLAFFFLMLAYLARPLVRLFPQSAWPRVLLRNRRYLGLAMALAHTVHFGYVVALFVYTDTPLGLVTAVGGGLAFVLMWLMAATSNNWSMRRMGRYWGRLHTVGLHYLWLIFMQSFVTALLLTPFSGAGVPEQLVYLTYLLLVLAGSGGLLLRIAQRVSRAR